LPLSSFAYVLVDALRRMTLEGTQWATAQVDTIRLKLIEVTARVRVTARRIVFHLSSSYPWQPLFRLVLHRLLAPDCRPTEAERHGAPREGKGAVCADSPFLTSTPHTNPEIPK
jgi:hypothetical protein